VVVALLAFALGMAADAALTLIAVHQIRLSQRELLEKASGEFEKSMTELAERILGDAVAKAVTNIPNIIRSVQERGKTSE